MQSSRHLLDESSSSLPSSSASPDPTSDSSRREAPRKSGRAARWFTLFLAAALAAACNTADLQQAPSSGNGSSGVIDDDDDDDDAGSKSDDDDDYADIPVTSKVTVQVQPSDSGAQILAAIKGATKSVHMTMYLLTNDDVEKALVDLHKAGKDVKVVLNRNFPSNGGSNQSAYNYLKNGGVPVVWAPSAYNFTHAKTIVIDGSQVIVMTMNLTAGSGSTNREFIAYDTDAADVKDAETIFDADYNQQTVTVGGKLIISPKSAQAVDPEQRLTKLMNAAKKTLDVEVQSLSDQALVDAIIAAQKRKVTVRVVITGAGDRDETPAQVSAIDAMKAAGVPLRGVSNPYIHSKVVVVDDKLAFVGSQNFTRTALFDNREVGVVTNATAEVLKVRDVVAEDFKGGTAR